MITKDQVLSALSVVIDPDLQKDLVTLGMIEDVEITDSTVSFTLVLTTPACPLRAQLERDARRAVQVMTGAQDVRIVTKSRVQNPKQVEISNNQFKHVIAVGSGKGGVGKSTVAANIAISLAQDGASVGLLDADIYGPNIPRMFGISGTPQAEEGAKVRPLTAYGVQVVSIGFFVADGQPLIWRGPMLHSAIQQFLTDFDWGCLDYLIVDLPPGTGDVQLSLSQTLPISGAVVVTTPQAVSIDDAFRAISMFDKLEIPVLGIVENMGYLRLPDGSQLPVFGEGGGKRLEDLTGVPLLGSIPLEPEVGVDGDRGTPAVIASPLNPASEAFIAIARNIAAQTSKQAHVGK
ncbi:MAG TPA: Mrp/NBP35 family ATP-binding protein [Anaerolineaceae bacterium]|jgi:ATP-binding protein involved in chromosome partitioning|nr:Mrp/NBP35 family ATP-binding protein [Anaerolineaceae bacterium]HOG76717.1 Mrp/NBP35 family ATP-binding protein [Anaerolineaceae bacterium]